MIDKAKSRLQQQIEKAWETYRVELHNRRLSYARNGFKMFREQRIGDAIEAYQTYIRILEEWKQVPQGGLGPQHFDKKKDSNELLTIAAVYWDLTRAYDRTNSAESHSEFRKYLNRYVLFSKDMPHVGLSQETVRKYIQNNKARHVVEFKEAYKQLGGDSCFIASALVSEVDKATIPILRRWRDKQLLETKTGRAAVRMYYTLGPRIASALRFAPQSVRDAVATALNFIARILVRLG